MLRLGIPSVDITFLSCHCITVKGPRAMCTHVTSLCYALDDFTRNFLHNKEPSCTCEMMSQPRKRKLRPKKLREINFFIGDKKGMKRKSKLQRISQPPSETASNSDKEAINIETGKETKI